MHAEKCCYFYHALYKRLFSMNSKYCGLSDKWLFLSAALAEIRFTLGRILHTFTQALKSSEMSFITTFKQKHIKTLYFIISSTDIECSPCFYMLMQISRWHLLEKLLNCIDPLLFFPHGRPPSRRISRCVMKESGTGRALRLSDISSNE